MANPYSTPLTARYKYKPLDVSVLAQPLAQQQQQYDLTEQAVDAAQFELAGLSPDSERAKEIKAVLGEQVGDISEGLLSKRDYRTAAKNLNKLNKFYNSNEEIKAIKGNYNAWQDAIKEQKKRLVGKNADLSQKQYEEWYQKSMIEFRDKGGTDFRDGDYNTINTMGRMSDMDKEIQDYAYKLANARPDEKRTILGKIQDVAGHRFKDQVIDTIITYQNKDDITAELYNQLSSSDRFKSWLDEKAEYNHFFQSYGNPEYAADMYGKYHAHLDEQEENIIKSKAKKKQKEAALANVEEQRRSLTEGYAKSKGDYIKGLVKKAHTQDYLMGVSSSMADVFNFQDIEYDRTFVDDFEAHVAPLGPNGEVLTGKEDPGELIQNLIGTSSTTGMNWTPGTGTGFKGLETNISGTQVALNNLQLKINPLKRQAKRDLQAAKTEEERQTIINNYNRDNADLFDKQKRLQKALSEQKAVYTRETDRVKINIKNNLNRLIAEGRKKGQDVSWYTEQLNLIENNISDPWNLSISQNKGKVSISGYLKGMQVDSKSKYDNSPLLGDLSFAQPGVPGYDVIRLDGITSASQGTNLSGVLSPGTVDAGVAAGALLLDYATSDSGGDIIPVQRMAGEDDRKQIQNIKNNNKEAILEFDVSSSDFDHDFAVLPYSQSGFVQQAHDRKNSWIKMLEEEGYTIVQGPRSNSDKHAYLDDIVVHHLRAVPNSLIKKQKEYVSNPNKNQMAILQKGVSEELYNQQMSRSTQDQGIILNDASNSVSGGVFNQLVDYQQQDTNNANTHRFYMNENGSYRMASDGMNNEEPNLNLYEAREVVGTSTVDGKQIPLIRYALKQDLTEGQIINEISRSGNVKAQTGGMSADEKRVWSATKMGLLTDDWRNVFSTDVVVGTLGTSFALGEAVKNTRKTFENIAEYGDGAQTANALTQLAQTEISLDGKMQDRLALDYIDLFQGTTNEIRNQGTPFAFPDGSLGRYDIIYRSTGGGGVTQEITLVDAKKYPNETVGKEILTQSLSNVMNSDVPAFMRSYELLYGINTNQAYMNNILNRGQNIDVASVGR